MTDHGASAASAAVPPFPFQAAVTPALAANASSAVASTRTIASSANPPAPSAASTSPAPYYAPLFSPPSLPASDPGGGGLANPAAAASGSVAPHAAPVSILSSSAILATNLAAMASLSLSALSPSELLFRARLSLQCERFEELTHYTRALVYARGGGPLSMEERGLFAVGFKRLLAAKRAGWRYAYSIELKEKNGRRKIEAEIARETERENKERANQVAAAAAAAAAAASASAASAAASSSAATAPAAPAPTISASIVPVAPPSSLPLLQARLAQSVSQLQILHGFRYQLFWEAGVLIAELQDLVCARLIPKLLPNQNESVMGFASGGMNVSATNSVASAAVAGAASAAAAPGAPSISAAAAAPSTGRGILGIVELCVRQELKRTSGGSSSSGGGGASSSAASSSTSAAAAPTPGGGAAASSTKHEKSADASASSSSSSSAATDPAASASSAGASLQLLTPLRNWSLENEIDAQLRLLDSQTHFLRALRSTPLAASTAAASSTSASAVSASSCTPASAAESLVFYLKLLADTRRLLAEFLAAHDYESAERNTQSLTAQALYCCARFVGFQLLAASHPTRLGLVLNQSAFYYEVLAKPDRAAQLAKNAFDAALAEQRQAANAAAAAEKNSQAAAAASAANPSAAAAAAAGTGGAANAGGSAAAGPSALDGSSAASGAAASSVASSTAAAGADKAASGVVSSGSAAGAALITGASSGASLKDSLLIMQLLKNNLTMWTESS